MPLTLSLGKGQSASGMLLILEPKKLIKSGIENTVLLFYKSENMITMLP